MRAVVIVAIGLWFCPSVLGQASGRFRPPENFQCNRNHLTSFTGVITQYKRTAAGITMRMKTEEATRERFLLRGEGKALESQFLLNAKPFEPEDWKRIERSKSQVRSGTRATVWVCEAPKSLLVDWNPKQ